MERPGIGLRSEEKISKNLILSFEVIVHSAYTDYLLHYVSIFVLLCVHCTECTAVHFGWKKCAKISALFLRIHSDSDCTLKTFFYFKVERCLNFPVEIAFFVCNILCESVILLVILLSKKNPI